MILLGRIVVLLMVLLAPWMIGSTSKAAQCLLMGLALVAMVLWWLELAFTKKTRHVLPYLSVPVFLGILLGLFQLLPLSPGVASMIAPRQAEVYADLGSLVENEQDVFKSEQLQQGPPVRISLNPEGTWDFIQLAYLSFCCLLLAAHYFCSRQSVTYVAVLLTLQGLALSLFGLVQKFNFNGKIYWFVERTYGGKPFSSFINRNNASGYLLLCLAASLGLAYFAMTRPVKHSRPRPIIGKDYPFFSRLYLNAMLFVRELTPLKVCTLISTAVIILAIVTSLSRGGMVALIFSIVIGTWIVGLAKAPKASAAFILLTILLTVFFVGWMGSSSNIAQRFESLNSKEELFDEGRIQIWKNSMNLFSDHSVFGSGMNSFRHVYRGYRHAREARLNEHAENQYVQTLTDTGVVGGILLLCCLAIVIWNLGFLLKYGNSPKTITVTTIGVFAICGQMIASVFDFGLYIPANTILFAFICGLVSGQAHALADRLKKKNWFSFMAPKWLSLAVLFGVFVFGVSVWMSYYQQSQLKQYAGRDRLLFEPDNLDLQDCQKQIKSLEERLSTSEGSFVHRHLAALYLHEFRLKALDRQLNLTDTSTYTAEQYEQFKDQVWQSTNSINIHRLVSRAREIDDQASLRRYLSDPIILENFPKVRSHLIASRYFSPMDPVPHLILAEIDVFNGQPNCEPVHLERASSISPLNSSIKLRAGRIHLHAGRMDESKSVFRNLLESDPSRYDSVIYFSLANGLSGTEIVDEILPDSESEQSARIYYDFATGSRSIFLDQTTKSELLRRADLILLDKKSNDSSLLNLHAEVKIAQGQLPEAGEILENLLKFTPGQDRLRIKLLNIYEDTEQWDKAEEQCRWLARNSNKKELYRARLDRLRDKMK